MAIFCRASTFSLLVRGLKRAAVVAVLTAVVPPVAASVFAVAVSSFLNIF